MAQRRFVPNDFLFLEIRDRTRNRRDKRVYAHMTRYSLKQQLRVPGKSSLKVPYTMECFDSNGFHGNGVSGSHLIFYSRPMLRV